MALETEVRSRQFSAVMYVAKEELDKILNALRLYHNLKECAYIYHNRDVDENGEPKEKHVHIYLYFINARELKGVYYLLKTYTQTNVLIQICKNRYVLVNEYFIHKDNTNKVQYNKSSGKYPITAQTAGERMLRTQQWLKNGCNGFDMKLPISNPMSFWTEQDILQYIKENSLPIASVYGDIVYSDSKGSLYDNLLVDGIQDNLCTTGCKRTGCIFCAYGAHLEKGESRFERLKRTHPRQYEYCMGGGGYDSDGLRSPTKDGLGMSHCIDELNKLYSKGDKKFIEY